MSQHDVLIFVGLIAIGVGLYVASTFAVARWSRKALKRKRDGGNATTGKMNRSG